MAHNLGPELAYWYKLNRRAEQRRQDRIAKGKKVEAKMVLEEKYVTKNGTHVFSAPGSDLEFVLVERHRMLWYLGLVDQLEWMGINPERIKPIEPDKL